MKILLTNDDGIHAAGLWALFAELASRHEVTVVAPDRERSAVGHGITLHEPLRIESVTVNGGSGGYAVNGTPVDCIKLGLLKVLSEPPDAVVAGINPGANVGVNINYSGTVAAAKEAAMYGIQSVAASIQGHRPGHYDAAARFVLKLVEALADQRLPRGTFLNVNHPDLAAEEVNGVRFGRHGVRFNGEYLERRVDPRQRPYFWQGCDMQTGDKDTDTDTSLLSSNYIVITPIQVDMTDYGTLDRLQKQHLETAAK